MSSNYNMWYTSMGAYQHAAPIMSSFASAALALGAPGGHGQPAGIGGYPGAGAPLMGHPTYLLPIGNDGLGMQQMQQFTQGFGGMVTGQHLFPSSSLPGTGAGPVYFHPVHSGVGAAGLGLQPMLGNPTFVEQPAQQQVMVQQPAPFAQGWGDGLGAAAAPVVQAAPPRVAKPRVKTAARAAGPAPERSRHTDPGDGVSIPPRGSRARAAPFERWADAPAPPSKRSRTLHGTAAPAAPPAAGYGSSPDRGASAPSSPLHPKPSAPGSPLVELPAHNDGKDSEFGLGTPILTARPGRPCQSFGNTRRLAMRVAGAAESYMRCLDYRTFESVLSLGCDIAWALFPDPRAYDYDPKPVVLVDSEGREWPCRYHVLVSKHSYVLRSGWKTFVRENGIVKHDIVVLSKAPEAANPSGLPRVRIDIISRKGPSKLHTVPASVSTESETAEASRASRASGGISIAIDPNDAHGPGAAAAGTDSPPAGDAEAPPAPELRSAEDDAGAAGAAEGTADA